MINYNEFAIILKTKRIEKGLTQKDVAKYIITNISTYNRIEKGLKEPTFMQLQLLATLFNLDLNKILKLKEPNLNSKKNFD